jgi:hypothetical protein
LCGAGPDADTPGRIEQAHLGLPRYTEPTDNSQCYTRVNPIACRGFRGTAMLSWACAIPDSEAYRFLRSSWLTAAEFSPPSRRSEDSDMSKKDESISLPGVLSEIEIGTHAYRAAATELTNRIVKFEEWLGRLPGKVQAAVYDSDDEDGDYYFVLSLSREGKQWKLRHWTEHVYTDEIMGAITDLRDASIEVKIHAMGMFPRLLGAIRDSQFNFVTRSAAAAEEFDKFAALIGIDKTTTTGNKSKEGK